MPDGTEQPLARDRASVMLLAADIGGTRARVGLVRGRPHEGRLAILAYREYRCAGYSSLEAMLHDFIDRHAQGMVCCGALACAGYVSDDVVINNNLPWPVDAGRLRRQLGLDDVSLINDFEALAYATQYLDPNTTTTLGCSGDTVPEGPQVVVGPGTGLGSAVLLPASSRPRVLASEAGQMALAPGNALEADILRVLAQSRKHVSCEHALSGPGLVNIYRALCALEDVTPALRTPRALTDAALADTDAAARRALEVFCAMLGSFAGDLAMIYRASGGVWLAGGILPRIRHFLARSAFVERFLEKGCMRAFLEHVPIHLMEHDRLGAIGAAHWYLDHGDSVDSASAPSAPSARQVDSCH